MLPAIHESFNPNEYKLIIPSVSVGNIGQLTVDLLILNLNLTKVGSIRHRNIVPIAAPDPKGLLTECELYASSEHKIAVVQIRSSYGIFHSIADFLHSLCKSFKCVVILTGSYAYERRNIHLVSEPLYYLATDGFLSTEKSGLPVDWKKLEEFNTTSGTVKIPGSGIADHLYNMCEARNIPVLLIVSFISEGDNREDAVDMANYLDSWLNSNPKKVWEFPALWGSLFGNPVPQDIF